MDKKSFEFGAWLSFTLIMAVAIVLIAAFTAFSPPTPGSTGNPRDLAIVILVFGAIFVPIASGLLYLKGLTLYRRRINARTFEDVLDPFTRWVVTVIRRFFRKGE
jgi:hypothetical protein